MRRISAEELRSHLREMVEMLGAAPADQLRWLFEKRVPVDELALQLDDAIRTQWLDRLTQEHALSPAAASAVLELHATVLRYLDDAHSHLWTDDALASEPEWARIRELARQTLQQIDRRRESGGAPASG